MTARLSDVLSTDPFAPVWFQGGSYVDEVRRILYVATPKVACSSIKFGLRGLVTDRPLTFNQSRGETRLSMFIHDRSQFPLPALTDFPRSRVDAITSEEGWFRFCVVRDPLERFFSAWRDKIFLCEPGFETYATASEERFVDFRAFLDRVVTTESAMTCETHWRSQFALLRPDAINYSGIYHLSALGALSNDLAQHLATVAPEAPTPSFERRNEGYAIPSAGFLTSEAVALLRRFYDIDYQRFGFIELRVADVPPVSAGDFVSPFTDAIWDRNRVIFTHIMAAAQRSS